MKKINLYDLDIKIALYKEDNYYSFNIDRDLYDLLVLHNCDYSDYSDGYSEIHIDDSVVYLNGVVIYNLVESLNIAIDTLPNLKIRVNTEVITNDGSIGIYKGYYLGQNFCIVEMVNYSDEYINTPDDNIVYYEISELRESRQSKLKKYLHL